MLYEPTNIIPSTLTQTGTVAQKDAVNIQWQVNGNSAMSMFQIDVMQNNSDSMLAYSTGIVSNTTAPSSRLPFYGKDRFGDYISFEYAPSADWGEGGSNSTNWGLVDGNNYKFVITSFYSDAAQNYAITLTNNLSIGLSYYFSYSVLGETYYVSFTVTDISYFTNGSTIYYSHTNQTGWVRQVTNNQRVAFNLSFSRTATQPTFGTNLNSASEVASSDIFYNQYFTTQNAPSSFIMRTEPILTIDPFTTPVASSVQSFTATYSQAQGDTVSSVRWQLFNASDTSDALDDTGTTYTPVLEYEYNGLFNNTSYVVSCTVETSNGVSVTEQVQFSVQYTEGSYQGEFTAQCLASEDSTLLTWNSIENIPGENSPENSAVVADGQLSLPENATVSWSQKTNEEGTLEPIDFQQPWTAVWNGDINEIAAKFLREVKGVRIGTSFQNGLGSLESIEAEFKSTVNKTGGFDDYVVCAAMNTSGNLLILGGSFSGKASIFSISSSTAAYVGDVTFSSFGGSISTITSVAFNHAGDEVVFCASLQNGLRVYLVKFDVQGTELSNQTLLGDSTTLYGERFSYCLTFSEADDYLVSINNNYSNFIFFIQNGVYGDPVRFGSGGFAYNYNAVSIHPSGDYLAASYGNGVSLYSVSGTTISQESTIYSGSETCGVAFNSTGSRLYISASNKTQIYSFSNGSTNLLYETSSGDKNVIVMNDDTVLLVGTLLYDISADTLKQIGEIELNNDVAPNGYRGMIYNNSTSRLVIYGNNYAMLYTVGEIQSVTGNVFSASSFNSTLVIGGSFNGYASCFEISGNTVSYEGDIRFSDGTPLDGAVSCISHIQNNYFAFGGEFTGKAALFSIATRTVYQTLKRGDVALDGNVLTCAYNTNKNILVIGGYFSGRASIFSVSLNGDSATYLSDITKNGDVSSLGIGVFASAVDPNGTLLVLGGSFDGGAAIFSFGENTVTYLMDITKNDEKLTPSIRCCDFSPNGEYLLLGGDFEGHASIFSIGANPFVKYELDITKNGSPLTASVFDCTFSPMGNGIILYPQFGNVMLFSIAGLSIDYISDINQSTSSNGCVTFFNDTTLFIGENINASGFYSYDEINVLSNRVYCSAFSPDGTLLVLGGAFSDLASLFSVSGNTVTYVADIKKGSESLNGSSIRTAMFSPDGKALVLGGYIIGRASIFSVNGTSVTYVADITKNGTDLGNSVFSSAFSPNGSLLVLGGEFSGRASVFSVSGTTVTYIADITRTGTGTLFYVESVAFSPDGSLLVLAGDSGSYASAFSVSGSTVTFLADITKSGTALNGNVNSAVFNHDGSLLVLGGAFSGFASAFSVNGTSVTYIADITKNSVALMGTVNALSFSSDGSMLALGGSSDNYASLYNVDGTNFAWVADIAGSGATINGSVDTIAFYVDDSFIVLGGAFTGYAESWSIQGKGQNIEKVFEIEPNNVYVSKHDMFIFLNSAQGTEIGKMNILGSTTGSANQIAIALTPTVLQVYSFLNGTYLGMREVSVNYTQQNVSAARLQGEQTCNYFSIIDGNGTEGSFLENLTNPNFEPKWNNGGIYTVRLLANFLYGIDGGTGTLTGIGYRIYREESNGATYTEVASLPSTVTNLKDYGIKSGETYTYYFYAYDSSNAFMGVRTSSQVCKRFKLFSLLSTQYNESDNCYHVVKEYQFSCNIQDMAVSNNSNKSYVQNFTPYPTVFQSTANYASGTLQALIGFVDPKAYKYWDSTQLMDELNALSTTANTLFLKDMKGHLWMVDVGTVQMTATQKTREMQVTISLPWTEIGDASDVSIIQTPDDEGWNNDAQVLDVTLDVDVETGLLQVVYPFPYNGTAFYLVGVTPEGVVNAVQPLPSKASQPTDGQLKAVVRHK